MTTNKLEQAARQILEAIEGIGFVSDYWGEKVTALREALAGDNMSPTEQAQQEPVAWMNDSTPMGVFARHKEGAQNFGCTIPLYAAPVRTKDLTDDEVRAIANEWQQQGFYMDFARAVIAADREKNK